MVVDLSGTFRGPKQRSGAHGAFAPPVSKAGKSVVRSRIVTHTSNIRTENNPTREPFGLRALRNNMNWPVIYIHGHHLCQTYAGTRYRVSPHEKQSMVPGTLRLRVVIEVHGHGCTDPFKVVISQAH